MCVHEQQSMKYYSTSSEGVETGNGVKSDDSKEGGRGQGSRVTPGLKQEAGDEGGGRLPPDVFVRLLCP